MKEYIKKFSYATAANDYPIAYIPFTTSIETNPIQNLVCNNENKKISVNGQGIVSIVDNAPELISFTIGGNTYQAEDGMTWEEWVESDYNTKGYYLTVCVGMTVIEISKNHYVCYGDEFGPSYGYAVVSDEEINNNEIYWEDNSPIAPIAPIAPIDAPVPIV